MKRSPPGMVTYALRLLRLLLLGVLGIAVALLLCEAVLRTGLVSPPRQIVRGHNLRSVGGVPVWTDGEDRFNRSCVDKHPNRQRILFFGTSITHAGTAGPAARTFAALLEKRLNELRPNPGFCVLNFAQPGFGPEQRQAIASEEIPRYRPVLVLDQDWDTEWGRCRLEDPGYTEIDGAAFHVRGLGLRPDGTPGLAGVPDAVSGRLFRSSYLYQYLTLAYGEGDHRICEPGSGVLARQRDLKVFADLAHANGAVAGFYIVPDLSYSLRSTRPEVVAQEQDIIAYGAAHGFVVHPLRPQLADQVVEKIRSDDWHFNVEGQRAVAKVMEPWVLQLLDGRPPTAP